MSLTLRLDYSTIVFESLSGVGRYIVELSKALQETTEIRLQGACKLSRWHRRKFIQKHLPTIDLFTIPALGLPPDIFHGPDFAINYKGKAKKVVTIHDLATFYPNLVESKRIETPLKGNIQKIFNNTQLDAIITVSEFTKKEILHFFPNLDKPIFVTPLAANHKNFQKKSSNPKPYLLYVGVLDRRKNVLGLCQAFEMIASKYPEFQLILVGSHQGFETEKVLDFIVKSQFQKQFVLKNFVSEKELQELYANAWAFVFPSFYEGFGIPVLEAMHYGLPVLTSQNSSMQEIADKAALYINPYEITNIAEGLEKIISDNFLRKELIDLSNERISFFSWQNTAEKTLQAYKSILKNKY
jgi:glycosyltransferase involved in cell wall biosynthesis